MNTGNFAVRLCRTGIVLGGLSMLAACASLNVQSNYQPPKNEEIRNTIVVDKPFDRAWDEFVRKLSQSFFVVNTISKESRLISITVRGARASDYFDCGRLTNTVNGEAWVFSPGEDSEFHKAGSLSETTVQHKVTANGTRMNVFIAPEGGGTLFEVNSSYSVSMTQNGQSVVKNVFGQVRGRDRMPTLSANFAFTTRTYDEQFFGNTKIVCQATGVWENEILSLASS